MLMARPWRIQFEDAVYHITARGNNKQDIFLDAGDRDYFMLLVGRVSKRFGLEVFAFCLMSNHFHLFMRTPLGNLSSAMHWLNGTYTNFFNWKHKRTGHLLQGRYKSVLVTDEVHYRHLSMYVHLNPVRAAVVERPASYPWSSYIDYTGLRSRYDWLKKDEILGEYGTTTSSRSRKYAAECLAFAGIRPSFAEQLKTQAILGSKELAEKLAKKYRPSGKITDVAQYTKTARPEKDLDRELSRVAEVFGVKKSGLMQRRYRATARLACYYHLVENCGMKTKRVAEFFAVGMSAVSMGNRCIRRMMETDKDLKMKISQLAEF